MTCTFPRCSVRPPTNLLAKSTCKAAWLSSMTPSHGSKTPKCLVQLDQSGVCVSTSRSNDNFILLRSSPLFSACMSREKYWRRHNIFDSWYRALTARMLRRLTCLKVSPWASKALKKDNAIKVQACWRVRVILPALNLQSFCTIRNYIQLHNNY